MNADKVGDAFLQLPKEIRDEIYGHYFSKSYLVLWSLRDADGNKSTCWEDRDLEPQSLFRNVSDSNTPDLADFAILRTCKGINSDAQDILYSKATTFIYVMNFGSCAIYTTPPAREATDRMMNVEFELSIYRDESFLESMIQMTQDHEEQLFSRMQATCGPTLNRFAGTSVVRNSFRITLEIGSLMYNDSIGHLIRSPFFQILKKLIGFQRVTIGLTSSVLDKYEPESEARETVRKVQKAFEPHLGPSVERVEYDTIEGSFSIMTVISVEIEFEPHKFHIENL